MIHAFYDTGQTVTVAGKVKKVLKPLLPFGYLLEHEGPFYGFSDLLSADGGSPLTQVGPDLYKVMVPTEGSIRIRSKIAAEETPPCLDSCCNCKPPVVNVTVKGCHCRAAGGTSDDRRLWPLALIPFLAFFVRRRAGFRRRA
jgi:hypothetical protein